MAREFIVQIEDRPGALSQLAHVLALRSINIHHLAAVTAGKGGLVVLAVSNDEAARETLNDNGYSFVEGDEVLAEVEDKPGALAAATETLAAAGVDVRSALEVGRTRDKVELAFLVDDAKRARDALRGR